MQGKAGIVWLASYPRSGNTWTRNFLNNLFHVLEGKEDAAKDINTLAEWTIWDIPAERFERVIGKKLDGKNRTAIAAARGAVQRAIADEATGPVLVKTHNALVLDRGHPTINMSVTSGAIYIVRNPLDVVISYSHHFACTLDQAIQRMGNKGAETDANEHVAYEVYGSWSENVSSWTRKPHPAIHVVRYEDMIADPNTAFGKLAAHLRIEATERQVARAVELASFETAKRQEQEKGYRERPANSKAFFREGRAEQWRETLAAQQVARIVADHREQMARFSYVPEGL
jgi:hypothetical protein